MQNKAGGEMCKVKGSIRLVEGRGAGLVEVGVTETRASSQNSIQKVNIEIRISRNSERLDS